MACIRGCEIYAKVLLNLVKNRFSRIGRYEFRNIVTVGLPPEAVDLQLSAVSRCAIRIATS